MELCRGAAGGAGHNLSVPEPVKAPYGGLAAPVGHVLAVQIHAVLKLQAVPGHAPQQFRLGGGGQPRQPAAVPGGQQAFADHLGLGGREALLALQQLADGVVHHKGRVGQGGPPGAAQPGDKHVVFVQRHLVRVGKDIHLPDPSGGIVPDVHGRAHRQHRGPLPLAGIGRRRQLGVAEGVQHPVVADPVAGAKILVGGVVEHTPAEAPRVLLQRRVLHADVAQGVLLPPGPGVPGLGGEHMAVALGDQQGLAHVRGHRPFGLGPGGAPVVGKVVIGVHVLQQMALLQAAHAGGLAAGIQLMGGGVGAGVQPVVVQALVDPHPPQHHGGVVPVLQHHLPDVFHRLILPGGVPDVLPAGQLGEHQQAKPVALVQEILALGVVAGANSVTAQLLLQNAGVLPLEVLRGGIAHVRIALVAVQPPQEGLFAVEIEAVRRKPRGAEAERRLLPIQLRPVRGQQPDGAAVQDGALRVPGPGGGDVSHPRCARPHRLPGPVQNGRLQPGALRRAIRLHPDLRCSQVGGGDKEVGDIPGLPHIQPRLPVQPAVGEVVHHEAEGRDGRILAGVQLHRQQVLPRPHQPGQLHPESGVAAAVDSGPRPVDVHRGDVGRAVQLKEQPLPL